MSMEWRNQKLNEIASFFEDGNWIESKDQSPKGFWLIQTGNIGVIVFRNKEVKRFVNESTFQRLKCTEIFAGDILISRLPDPVGRSCIVPQSEHKMLTAVDCTILRLKPEYDARYVNYLINADATKSQVHQLVTGSSRKRISRKNLGTVSVPVPFRDGKPDFAEQKHIAEKLDKMFAEIESGEKVANRNALLSRKLFASYLRSGFEGAEIDEVALGSICAISGGFGFPHAYQGRKSEKYPFYKVSDMNTSGNEVYMKMHNHSVSDEDVKKLKLKIYPAGTIIFPKIGAAIATNKKRILSTPSTVDNNVMVLVPKEGVSSEYLYNYLLNFDLSDWSNKSALPSIRKSDVEKTIVPIPMKNGKPDYGAQETFANAMKAFQEKAVLLERLSRVNVQKLQGFRQSVLSHILQPQEVVASVAAPIVSPIQPVVAPKVFDIQQAVAQILKRFERGEMVVAKVLYLGQVLFGVPTNIQFSAQNFGPYDTAVKKAVTAGLSPRNKFFAKKGSGSNQVLTLGTNANNILKYSTSALARKTNTYLDQMLPLFNQSDSAGIERLATLCKIIEDERTADETVVKAKLQEWKPNKFTDEEVSRTLAFIKKQGWDQTLLK